MKNKGAISIPASIVIPCIITACGIVGTFFAARMETNEKIAEVNTQVQVVEAVAGQTKENVEEKIEDMAKDIDKLDRKMDAILSAFSIKVKEEKTQ